MSYSKKVKIILHGYLKKLYPHDIELSGYSVAELVNGLCKQTKAFNPKPGDERHCVSILGYTNDVNRLYDPIPPDMEELHIIPNFCGGKGGGIFKIVLGVVFVAAAFLTMGTSLGATPLFWGATTLNAALFSIGTSLLLGGLLEMLSPAPVIDQAGVSGSVNSSTSDPAASKYLGASQNTVRIGTRIPLLYGEHQAYGHYISFDVDAVDVAV